MQLSQEEQTRCQTFLSTFNDIEAYLRQTLKENEQTEFKRLIDQYIDRRKAWRSDRQKLRNLADLRNILVHQTTEPSQYPAVPSERTIKQVKQFRDRLINPLKVIPTFQREVETLTPERPLAWVFQRINACDYSQFPVYEGDRFIGLLTENGITRWLARHTVTNLTLIEFEEILITKLLPEEEIRTNCSFIARDISVDEVIEQFSDNLFLEAVLITQNGKKSEKLLGIATRWDILKYLQDRE
ncbi:CBS domain-containing protein [Egbenema bharatensis]|uniref:CBS domain-containing protein n=1 Tax=Egbenema bharatensis TaxID=3463334 RepID=UPI003A876CB2